MGKGTKYRFTVRGDHKAQPRVKAYKRGAHAGVYTPGSADYWKTLVVEAGRSVRPSEPISGPVRVDLWFYFKRPKRLCRKKDPACALPHTSKPDRDNLEKAVLDCLTQDGWWHDDAQVCEGGVRKLYHPKEGWPGLVAEIRSLQGNT